MTKLVVIGEQCPPMMPGHCALCGYSGPTEHQTQRLWLDIGLTIDFYGTVYFCEVCAGSIARAFGFKQESEFIDQEMKLAELGEREAHVGIELKLAKSEIEELRNAINTFTRVNSSSTDSSPSPDVDNKEATGSAKTSGRSNKGPTKSPTEQRPKNVQRSHSDDELTELLGNL
jgi:hypothetical protein